MIAAHYADANYADAQGAVAAEFLSLTHDPKSPRPEPNPGFPLACPIATGDRANVGTHTQIASEAYGRPFPPAPPGNVLNLLASWQRPQTITTGGNRPRCGRCRPRRDSYRSEPRSVRDRSCRDFPAGASLRSGCRSTHFRAPS